MTLSRTILTLMTGTAIALGTVGYGSHAMAADNALSADELTMQAFEQMQSGPAAAPKTKAAPATKAPAALAGPSMTGPSITGPAIAVPSNVGAVLSGTAKPVEQNPVKEQQVRAVAAVPPTTNIRNVPAPRTEGVEIDLGVLSGEAAPQPAPVQKPVQKLAQPKPVAPIIDVPATIEVSSKTHPAKNTKGTAFSGMLTAPEPVAAQAQQQPVIATAPVRVPLQAPAPKIAAPKIETPKTETVAVAPSEPFVKTVPSKPISAPAPQQLAQKPVVQEKQKVEIRDVVVAASAPKQGKVSTNPDGYTAIIAPKPQNAPVRKPAPEVVKAEPPPLPPEAEKVIAQIESMPTNAPRAPDVGATTSFPISMKGKTDAAGIDRVLMQTGRIASDTITLSKIQSTDPSVPPVPASPVATVAAAPAQESTPAPEKKPDAPVVAAVAVKEADKAVEETPAPKVVAEKIVEPEEAKPAPIILSKTPEPEVQPEELLAETAAPKAEPIKTRIVKVQKIAKNAPIPAEKPAVTAKAEEEPMDDSAADMAAIAPAAGEQDVVAIATVDDTVTKTEKIAVNAPVPTRRPAIQNASIEFVERARRTYQAGEVYRVAARGDDAEETRTPTYKTTASYSGGAIPAPTLSVADLGSDPLARQVVDMSAEDIAVALNNIETAAGTGSMIKNNSARPYGTAYDQMPVVQRGFIFRPKEREKEAAAEREAIEMAQNDAAVEPQTEQTLVTSEAPVTTEAPVQKPRTLAVPPRPPVVNTPEPVTEEPAQKRTEATTDTQAEEIAMISAERPDAPRPGRKPVAENTASEAAAAEDSAALNTIEPAAKGDSAEEIATESAPVTAVTNETSPISLPYDKGVGTVSDDVLAETMDDLLTRMKDNSGLRVQIVSFASPVDNSQSGSRRTSLSRALNVRAWMMENGIDPSRMDVRALGVNPDSPETDRVDVVVVNAE